MKSNDAAGSRNGSAAGNASAAAGNASAASAPLKSRRNRTRLREILGILRRHKVLGGMTPEKFRLVIEDLGPTFIKLGQILSTRKDMLPEDYCRELSLLRTRAAAVPFEEIRSVLEKEYEAPLDTVFASFSSAPLGSASIAQAHTAVLHDGRPVVVKVQRPGIREPMARDIVLLRRAARLLNRTGIAGSVLDFRMVLDEMYLIAQQEMDFLTEGDHLERFAQLNRGIRYVACPRVERSFSTALALVMERVDGIAVDDADALDAAGYDRREIGDKLAENYVKQVMDDAFFHADPHPGNIRIRGGQIVWLDLGMMGRLSERDRTVLRRAMRALVENDVAGVKDALLVIGVHSGRVNHARLYGDIDEFLAQYATMGMRDMNLAQMMEELMALASAHGISIPEGIVMLGRGILILQSVLASLDPDINLVAIMTNHLSGDILAGLNPETLLRENGRSLLSSLRKGTDVPGQLSDLLKMTIKGQTKYNLEIGSTDEARRHADRLTDKLTGSILAGALFICGGLLCTADLSPRLWGLPVPGLAAFLLAGVLTVRVLVRRRKK